MTALLDDIAALDLNTPFILDDPKGDTIRIAEAIDLPEFELGSDEFQPRHVLNQGPGEWMTISGLSNQEGYTGPILHPSENLSEGIITEIRERTRHILRGDPLPLQLIWIMAEVIDPDDRDALVGWVLALTITPISATSSSKGA